MIVLCDFSYSHMLLVIPVGSKKNICTKNGLSGSTALRYDICKGFPIGITELNNVFH